MNPSWLEPLTGIVGMTPLIAGCGVRGLSKRIDQSDEVRVSSTATKEMSFIRLDQESKVKGKAAIDVIGSRLGKSGAAWVQIVLIQIAGTGINSLCDTFLASDDWMHAVVFWILSVRSLNKQFTQKPDSLESVKS